MINPTSQRFEYQLMNDSDADLLFSLDQDPEVMKYINGGKMTSRAQIVEVYLPRLKSFSNPAQGWGLWKLTLSESKRFVGWVLLRPMEFFSGTPEFDNLEIGWRLFRDDWGKGYATEAATAICEAVVEASKAGYIDQPKFISAVALAENSGSINVMEKIGLSYVKTAIHRDPLGDSEAVFYQMTI